MDFLIFSLYWIQYLANYRVGGSNFDNPSYIHTPGDQDKHSSELRDSARLGSGRDRVWETQGFYNSLNSPEIKSDKHGQQKSKFSIFMQSNHGTVGTLIENIMMCMRNSKLRKVIFKGSQSNIFQIFPFF